MKTLKGFEKWLNKQLEIINLKENNPTNFDIKRGLWDAKELIQAYKLNKSFGLSGVSKNERDL